MGVFITTTRWPAEVYDRIKATADSKGISVNALIVEAGKQYLTANEKDKKEGKR